MKKINLLLLLFGALLISSCNKDKKKDDPTPSSDSENSGGIDLSTTASYYFIFQKGDKAVKLEQSKNSLYCGSESYGSEYLVCGGGMFKINSDYSLTSYGAVYYGKYWGSEAFPDAADNYASYSTGSGSFGNEDDEVNGFILTYTDENGVFWSTEKSTGDQTGSTINITSKSAYENYSIYYIVDGTFECTFYNSSGASFKATNGKFKTQWNYGN